MSLNPTEVMVMVASLVLPLVAYAWMRIRHERRVALVRMARQARQPSPRRRVY